MSQQSKPSLSPVTIPIVVATSNEAKLAELRAILGVSSQLLLRAPSEFKEFKEFNMETVEETGQTFVENAIIKARHAACVSGLASIADDSGLTVEALCGQPGVYSARYASISGTINAQDNIAKLLQQLAALPDSGGMRVATLVCVLVFMRSATDPAPLIAEGHWHGRILAAPTETHVERLPFGYDAVFEVDSHGCSAAQLSFREKNRISHRGQAVQRLLHQLSAF